MSQLSDAEALNYLAHGVVDTLDAGAVVILALVEDDDGSIAVAVGSTGLPHTTRVLAEIMPRISREILEACASEGSGRTEKSIIHQLRHNDEN